MVVGGYTHVLTGTRDPSIVAMTVNGMSGRITFPTGSTWQLHLVLNPGVNTLKIRGCDSVPNWTSEVSIELSLPSFSEEAHTFFNTLDEHSMLVGINRNPGEKNWFFRNRMLAFAGSRTGASLEGLFYAAAYELGIKPVDQALSLRIARDSSGELIAQDVYVEIAPIYMWVDSPNLVKTGEAHLVEPRTRSIQLDETPAWLDEVKIFDQNGNRVQDKRFTVDSFEKTVTFTDDELNGTWVSASYPYRSGIAYQGMDLSELATAIAAVQVGGQALIDVVVSSGSLTAAGLRKFGRTLLTRGWFYIPHAGVQVVPLDDRHYQQSLLNRYGAAYDTKLERYARRARERSTIGWDNLVLDEGLWDVGVDDRALDFLPRLWDPVFGRWFCQNPTCERYFDLWEYWEYNGRCPIHGVELKYMGLPREEIKSGICESASLYADAVAVEEEL